ncbi:MAG TPA: SDR family NAD(P)-dependent oxidoreductase [Planctomycetaceae bacterium]|nr:SDR family NAD(P)-dependent oxidoreductase [Planctomycetaceae bacterium]HQZ65595.1 SDR family NAD(P)-dependent oxidoreductase [Planctomycetaceae bacterium]
MRLLITGGAGFIGSNLADKALDAGWKVAVLDDLSSGRRENVPAAAEFFQVDIQDSGGVEKAFAKFKPTAVSHQAAQASVAISVREPQKDASINIIGSINVMQACVNHKVGHLVFASTGGAIYGEVPDGKRASVATVPMPLSPYACSKFATEKYLDCFRHEHGLNYTVLRYANVYGPRQDPHGEAGVVAIFCNRLLANQPVSIFARQTVGDPGCVRDYVFIDDVVKANMAALQGQIPDRVLNVGTGHETNTLQLAEHLGKTLSSKSEVRHGDRRAGDVQRSVLDADRLAELLGSPVSVADGLKITAEWFRQRVAGT